MKGRVQDLRLLIGKRMLNRPFETPYSLLDMADDSVGLMDALGIPAAHVVGASMGGMIAQTMAITHPQRVRSLTSIMSGTGRRRYLVAHPRALAVLLKPAAKTRDQAIANELEFFQKIGGVRSQASDEALVRDIAARAYDRCFFPAGFIRQLAAVLAAPDRAPALRYVRVPATVIHGSHDSLILPYAARATAAAIPGARLRMIRDMGHDVSPGTWGTIAEEVAMVAARAAERERSTRVAAPLRSVG
jgi:pimeloyl-ACP methyl ester carboxylesterase